MPWPASLPRFTWTIHVNLTFILPRISHFGVFSAELKLEVLSLAASTLAANKIGSEGSLVAWMGDVWENPRPKTRSDKNVDALMECVLHISDSCLTGECKLHFVSDLVVGPQNTGTASTPRIRALPKFAPTCSTFSKSSARASV
jgi:hypothetical protein